MTAAQTTDTAVSTWTVDPVHTTVAFGVQHMTLSTFKGRFKKVEGTIRLDEADPMRSSVTASIDTASVVIEGERLYDVLLGDDFFQTAKYPAMTFQSTRVERQDDRHWKVYGSLTIRGVTRGVVLETEYHGQATHPFSKKTVAAFSATTEIHRPDFGLTWNAAMETGAKYLGERVTITLEIEAVKQV